MLVPARWRSVCPWAHQGWLRQPSTGVREWNGPVPHPLSSIPLGYNQLLCKRSLEAGGDYRWSSLNWVSTATTDQDRCQLPAQHRNAGPVGWGASVCDRYCLENHAEKPAPAPSLLCIRAGQGRPAKAVWKSCSQLGSKIWLWLTLDNETGDSTVWVCFPEAAATG